MRLPKNYFLSARFTTTFLLVVVILFLFNFNLDVFKAGAQIGAIGNGNVGYVSRWVDSLIVSFTASPGTFYLGQPEAFSTVVTGSVAGTTNYSIWWDCNYNDPLGADPTPTVDEANVVCGDPDVFDSCNVNQPLGNKCDNHGPLSGSDSYTTPGYAYSTPGPKRPFVIVERGGSTVMKLLPSAVTVIDITPSVSSTTVTVSNSTYCGSGVHANVSGLYSDPLGTSGDAYEILIDNNLTSNPNVPAEFSAMNPEWESGTISTTILNNGTFSHNTPLCPVNDATNITLNTTDARPQLACQIVWATTYTAWARVRNSGGTWSSWARMSTYINGTNPPVAQTSWLTPPHRFPQTGFGFTPPSPSVNSPVTFTDTTSFSGSSIGQTWTWTFNGGTPVAPACNGTSTCQGPHSVTYATAGVWPATLTAGDNAGSCPNTQDINVQAALPRWREVAPR